MPYRTRADRLRRTSLSVLVERVLFSSAAAVALGAGLLPAPTQAATIVVTSPGDTAVANPATCTLRQAVVSQNTGAVAGTGCIASGAFGSNDRVEFANGLFSAGLATISLQQSLIVGHPTQASKFSPPRPVKNLAIDAGPGREVVVERNAAAPFFSVIAARMAGKVDSAVVLGSLRVTGLIVQNGQANAATRTSSIEHFGEMYTAGGGIYAAQTHLVIERSTIRNNKAQAGGGVFSQGSLVVDSSTISNNAPADFVPDDCAPEACGPGGAGGGLFALSAVTIRNSTISGNTTDGQFGGAAMTAKYIPTEFAGGGVLIANSTISGNRVLTPAHAAAIMFFGDGDHKTLTLLNSTLADNCGSPQAIRTSESGFITSGPPPSVTASSTIFANAQGSACGGAMVPTHEIRAAGVEGSHNLLKSNSAIHPETPFAITPVFGDPLLGPLQNNGGPTATRAIPENSPARNAGTNPAGFGNDQRGSGYTRAVATTDIGAFENQVIGLCGTAHGSAFASAPATNLCSGGAEVQAPGVFGSGPWSWFCALPSDPINNAFCGAKVSASVSIDIWNQGGSSITSAVWGQPMRLRGSVIGSGPGGTPTGTLTFADVTDGGFRPLCVDRPLASPTLCDPTLVPIHAGTRQVRAIYGGSGTHGAASANRSLSVSRAASTTSIASEAPNPVPLGASFTLAANVSVNAPSAGTAYGTIEVHDTTDATVCTHELGADPPGCALTPTSAGVHALEVFYLGNGNIEPSMTTATQTVTKGATVTDLALSPGPITFGQPLTAIASLATTVAASIVVPTGAITVTGAGTSCTITLPAASCDLVPTGAGMHGFTASYDGDANFVASADTAQADVGAAATTANISVPATTTFGESLTVTATLASAVAPELAVPGGTIAIDDGAGASCTITLPDTQCDLTPTSAGARAITTDYAGDGNFAGSSAAAALEVMPAATSLSVQPALGEITLGQSVTVTAAVGTDLTAQFAAPSGTITLDDGAGAICTITLPATSCDLTPSSAGARTIDADYSGDGNFAPASGTAALDVLEPPADLALAISDGQDDAQPGDVLHYTITLSNGGVGTASDVEVIGTASANFGGATVAWTCTPSGGATCAESGSGLQFADTVTLSPGASLAWTVTIAVPADAVGHAVEFMVTAGEASAIDSNVLPRVFRDGFETGGSSE